MNIEKAIIGRMLMDKEMIPYAKALIRSNKLEDPNNDAIYKAMVCLYDECKPVDLITVQNKLKEMGQNPNIASIDSIAMIINNIQEDQ